MTMQSGVIVDEIHKQLNSNPWYGGTYRIFTQGDFPFDCPWQLDRNQTVPEIIKIIFQPIAGKLPKTVQLLSHYCRKIFVLRESNKWFLIYSQDIGLKFFCGGQPTTSPKLPPQALADGWELPDELKLFYSVHNGFGPLRPLGGFWNYDSVLPDGRLDTLNALFANELTIRLSYDPKTLLHFFPDGAGNGQCFYRHSHEMKSSRTVDWDHETREISKEQNFWEFIDSELSMSVDF